MRRRPWGASLFARDRRPGTLSLLLSLPIPRGRLLAAKLAAALVSLLLIAVGGLAIGGLAIRRGWTWEPGPDNLIPWWSALLAAAILAALIAVRVSLDWPEPLLPAVLGGGLGTLALQVVWVDVASIRGNVMTLVAALCAVGAAAWRLRARFEAVEDRAPRWPRDLRAPRPVSWRRAPRLATIEWRQKGALLGILAPWPLLHLVGIRAGWFDPFSLLAWAWLGGALVGASLFTARERDASRFLLHMLPIGRARLAMGRLLGGLIVGSLYLAECLLALRAAGTVTADDLSFAVLIFAFFYGTAFLIGATLSPWLRSTVVTALLALVSTYPVLLLVMLYRFSFESEAELWTATGLTLAVLAAVAGWSTMRSRAFEPSPRKDLRVVLTMFVLWLAIAGILYFD